jgi:hypothetical protein
MEYQHLIQNPKYAKDWTHSFANELGRLAQGVGIREEGTSACFFIHHTAIPQDHHKQVTYGLIVFDHRP